MHETMIGGTLLTNWLAIVGVISLIYWAWRIVAALRRRGDGGPTAARAPATAAPATAALATDAPDLASLQPGQAGPPIEDIAVIAAAVHAMSATQRIVRLEADRSDQAWTIEGRWAQQISHTPR
jgi:hypothetical protein